MADFPSWLLNLVAEVEIYEDCHEKFEDALDWRCLGQPLGSVPSEVRSMARGYAQAKREAEGG